MNIASYIEDLLYIHECVILPGFGGFVANYKTAEIREKQYSFLPPSKEIGFNSNLNNNDGLLINYISNQEDIGFPEARINVEAFVQSILDRLANSEEVHFEGIGSFIIDSQQNLLFEPEPADNFLIDSFGLSSFQFLPVEPDETSDRQPKRPKDKKAVKPPSHQRSFIRSTIIVSTILLVGGIVLMTPRPTGQGVSKNYYSSFIPSFGDSADKKLEELINNPESINEALQKMTNKRIALFYSEEKPDDRPDLSDTDTSATKKPETTEKQDTVIPEQETVKKSVLEKIKSRNDKFFLIAGSFTDKKQATDWLPNLTGKGYKCEILDEEKGKYRISIGAFSERTEADRELEKVRSKNIQVWILTKAE